MAKISFEKKIQKNSLQELSNLLQISNIEKVYPRRDMEPWRRFDPIKLADELNLAISQGTTMSKININDSDSSMLNTATNWKKSDEIFLQKAKNNLGLFKSTESTVFFIDLISKSVNDDHLNILKIPQNSIFESTATIDISSMESALDSKKVCHNILYIYCEQSSRAVINIVKNSSFFDLSIIYVFQEKNSEIQIRYMDEDKAAISHGVHFIKCYQEDNSTSKTGIYSLCAGQNKKVFVENTLMGSATSDYHGIFLGRYSKVDHDFLIEHHGSFSKSNLLFKMSVMDDSYGVFWGNTIIYSGTRGCEASQQNKNLILGNNSRVDAIPRLSIKTENVVASHGSATGEISDDEIFYMMSRGLSYDEARKLLLRGFFEDVLRQSFDLGLEISDIFLDKIWMNIQNILGIQINV